MSAIRLALVIPCYNEEEVLPDTNEKLRHKMTELMSAGKIGEESRILYVDDGSRDRTWELISQFCSQDPQIMGVKLAHNRGHQTALLAGLECAEKFCDCAISLDADLQDDIEVFGEFLEKFEEGCDIVYGVRSSRESDTAFKRGTAQGFYKLMKAFGVEIVYNHADYRLMSRRAIGALSDYKETSLFLRGIVPMIGYRTDYVYYTRGERLAGESKYPLKKMLSFAMDGITSFSVKPLRLLFSFGAILLCLAVIGAIVALSLGAFVGFWGIFCLIGAASGIHLIAAGVLGEYIGKIYLEAKKRPRYHIEAAAGVFPGNPEE
ncbi:MAG: glycosyltransferase family 2 protein [Clostridia bacterium]|nr:glycosyltransferase family 2 protein [Clostridia bacterium]